MTTQEKYGPGTFNPYYQGGPTTWEVQYDLTTPLNGTVAVTVAKGLTQENAELVAELLNKNQEN